MNHPPFGGWYLFAHWALILMQLRQSAGFERIFRTLGHRQFRLYLSGNSISLVGTWMQRIAVGWLAWELTESGFWLGFVAFCDLFPAVLIGPFGGVIADRLNRRHVLILCSCIALTQSFLLFALTAVGLMSIGLLAALTVLNGIIAGFYHPVRLSIMPSLLPKSDLANGIAINSVTFNFARFLGPAIAGLLILKLNIASVFAGNMLSYLCFIAVLLKLEVGELASKKRRGSAAKTFLADLKEGFHYTISHRTIGPMLLLLFAVSLCLRPFVDMLPALAAKQFLGGAETLALLTSSLGIGAMIAGLILAGANMTRLIETILAMTIALALSIVGFMMTTSLAFGLVAAAIAGACMVSSGISMQILMQMSVTDELRGRVLSLYSIIFFGGPAAGALMMGTLSEAFGFKVPFMAGAIGIIALVAYVWSRKGRMPSPS